MEKPWIGLLDCNNFFVSCERLFRPDLLGKPVVVLSGNDGCIVARSQEVKDMGVPMGVPYFQIKDTLEKSNTTTFSSHFALYRDISRRVFEVMRQELGAVQQYSVDEAFFTCAESDRDLPGRVKAAVEQRVGIPVSLGIAPSKTLAKHAGTLAKKGSGVHFLDFANWPEAAKAVSLASIWGVGGQLEMRYKQHGILTVHDLLKTEPGRLQQVFGVQGVRLQKELLGSQILTLNQAAEPQKSIVRSRSFGKETTAAAVVQDALAYHTRYALEDLRAMQCKARVVRVSIQPNRHGDYLLRGGSKEAVLSAPTDNTIEVLKVVKQLTQSLLESDVPYKKAGVTLLDFTANGAEQQSLFPDKGAEQSAALMPLIDQLNQRLGKDSIVMGSHSKTRQWQSLSARQSPSYTTQWSDLKQVQS